MREIKAPTRNRVILNIIDCKNCGAEYECLKQELKFVSDQRDGDFYWFKCPHCNHRKSISAELIK